MASLTERMIGAAKLDVNTFEEIEADQSALPQAMTVVALTAAAAGIGAIRSGVMVIVISVVGAFIGWFIWAGLCYLIGTKVLPEPQTKSDMGEMLRVLGFASTPGLLRVFGIVPVIGGLISFAASIWMLVAMVIAVRQALDYSNTWRAVGVCFIGWLVYVIFAVMLGILGAGAAAVGNSFA